MERTIVGIDVGTTKVCTLVGEATDNELKIVGVGEAPSRGIKKGVAAAPIDASRSPDMGRVGAAEHEFGENRLADERRQGTAQAQTFVKSGNHPFRRHKEAKPERG